MRLAPLYRLARTHTSETDEEFLQLVRIASAARMRGFYTKLEFVRICRWKARRAEFLFQQNAPAQIRRCTMESFAAATEQQALEALLALTGVRVPMASALLAAADPCRFGVIDVRAWRVLHDHGVVRTRRSGKGLQPKHWMTYQQAIRRIAQEVGTTPRLVEFALYDSDKRSGRKINGAVLLGADCNRCTS